MAWMWSHVGNLSPCSKSFFATYVSFWDELNGFYLMAYNDSLSFADPLVQSSLDVGGTAVRTGVFCFMCLLPGEEDASFGRPYRASTSREKWEQRTVRAPGKSPAQGAWSRTGADYLRTMLLISQRSWTSCFLHLCIYSHIPPSHKSGG